MPINVHASGSESIEYRKHAARLIIDFSEYRFALDEGIGASLKDRARLDIVRRLQDDVSDIANSATTDCLQVDPLTLKLAAEFGQGPRLMC